VSAKQIEGQTEQKKSCYHGSESAPIARPEVQIPQVVVDRYDADQKEAHRQATLSGFFQGMTLVIVAAYTAFTFWQWQAMLQQNRNTQQAINLSQLALIAEVVNSDTTKIVDGKTTLTFKNTGQTKALNVRVELFDSGFDFAPSDFDPFTQFTKLGDIKIDQLQATEEADLNRLKNAHLPEAQMNEVKKNWEAIARQAPHRTSLPPAYVREIPANTPVPYPVSLQQQSPVIFIFGDYRYDDELGRAHEDNHLCWRFESNTVSPCLMFQPTRQ
jgi:hypothetical protein